MTNKIASFMEFIGEKKTRAGDPAPAGITESEEPVESERLLEADVSSRRAAEIRAELARAARERIASRVGAEPAAPESEDTKETEASTSPRTLWDTSAPSLYGITDRWIKLALRLPESSYNKLAAELKDLLSGSEELTKYGADFRTAPEAFERMLDITRSLDEGVAILKNDSTPGKNVDISFTKDENDHRIKSFKAMPPGGKERIGLWKKYAGVISRKLDNVERGTFSVLSSKLPTDRSGIASRLIVARALDILKRDPPIEALLAQLTSLPSESKKQTIEKLDAMIRSGSRELNVDIADVQAELKKQAAEYKQEPKVETRDNAPEYRTPTESETKEISTIDGFLAYLAANVKTGGIKDEELVSTTLSFNIDPSTKNTNWGPNTLSTTTMARNRLDSGLQDAANWFRKRNLKPSERYVAAAKIYQDYIDKQLEERGAAEGREKQKSKAKESRDYASKIETLTVALAKSTNPKERQEKQAEIEKLQAEQANEEKLRRTRLANEEKLREVRSKKFSEYLEAHLRLSNIEKTEANKEYRDELAKLVQDRLNDYNSVVSKDTGPSASNIPTIDTKPRRPEILLALKNLEDAKEAYHKTDPADKAKKSAALNVAIEAEADYKKAVKEVKSGKSKSEPRDKIEQIKYNDTIRDASDGYITRESVEPGKGKTTSFYAPTPKFSEALKEFRAKTGEGNFRVFSIDPMKTSNTDRAIPGMTDHVELALNKSWKTIIPPDVLEDDEDEKSPSKAPAVYKEAKPLELYYAAVELLNKMIEIENSGEDLLMQISPPQSVINAETSKLSRLLKPEEKEMAQSHNAPTPLGTLGKESNLDQLAFSDLMSDKKPSVIQREGK